MFNEFQNENQLYRLDSWTIILLLKVWTMDGDMYRQTTVCLISVKSANKTPTPFWHKNGTSVSCSLRTPFFTPKPYSHLSLYKPRVVIEPQSKLSMKFDLKKIGNRIDLENAIILVYNGIWKKWFNRRKMTKKYPIQLIVVLCRLWVDINWQKRPVIWSNLHRRSYWRHNDLQNDVTFRGVPRVLEPACIIQVVQRPKEQPDPG